MVKKIVIGVIVVGVLLMAGCVAVVVSAGKSLDETIDKQEKNATPHPVTAGKAFTIGNWDVADGWKVTETKPFGYGLALMVTNASDSPDGAILTVKLLDGKSVVASIDCTTGELEPGQSVKANCVNDGDTKDAWSRITVENTF